MAIGKIYTVPTNQRPSYLNKEMAIGLLAGMFIPIGGMVLGPALVIGGGLTGAFLGRKRMEQELIEGKKISPPKLKNSGAAIGGLLSAPFAYFFGAAATAIGGGIGISMIEAGFLGAAVTQSVAITTVTTLGVLTGGLVFAGIIGVGALIGGMIGKRHMAQEYAKAEAAELTHGTEPAKAPAKARSQSVALEPAPVAAQNTTPDAPQFSFAEKIKAERAYINGLTPTMP